MSGVVATLPAVNALLNVFSTLAILTGIWFIRRGDRVRHQRSMWTAAAIQAVFLTLYLVKTYLAGTTVFTGPPLARMVYLFLLGSHMLLAILVTPLVVTVIYLAWRGRFAKHRRLARWTYPAWLYVTVTGPVVYLMLHRFYG